MNLNRLRKCIDVGLNRAVEILTGYIHELKRADQLITILIQALENAVNLGIVFDFLLF